MPETTSPAFHIDDVVLGLRAASREGALHEIATRIAAAGAGSLAVSIVECLAARERTASTAWGGGIAVPHARVAGLTRSHVVFARLAEPLDFGAADGRKVDLLLVVLSPADDPAEHLRVLARLARRLRDSRVLETLRGATDPATVRAALETE